MQCMTSTLVVKYAHRYQRVSDEVYNIFFRYTSRVLPMSIDEAFLDVSGLSYNVIVQEFREGMKSLGKLESEDVTSVVSDSVEGMFVRLGWYAQTHYVTEGTTIGSLVASCIRTEIEMRTGCTASAGIGMSMLNR